MHSESAAAFLSLFGQPSVTFTRFNAEHLFGTVVWSDNPSDAQEIAVDLRQPPLSADALTLITFVHERALVVIDRLTIGREQLRGAFLAEAGAAWRSDRFDTAYDELLRFRVSMMDGGSPTDSFFLHE